MEKIYLGAKPNDKTGTPARVAGAIINTNFEELEKKINDVVVAPFDRFKFIQKGIGNIDLENYEIGDIFCGWSNDGTIRIPEAIWKGGSLSNSDNFTPLVQIEIN